MKEVAGILIVFFTIVILSVVAISAFTENGQKRCAEKFGSEWSFRSGDRSPDICVDKEGNARYL